MVAGRIGPCGFVACSTGKEWQARRSGGIRGDELRALRELRRHLLDLAFVFATERGTPFTTDAINRQIKRIGERAVFQPSLCMFTCCGTPAATRWRMRRTIRATSRTGLGMN